MSNHEKFTTRKGENKSGLKSLFWPPQGTNNHGAQPLESKSFVSPVPGPQIGQSGGISSEDDGEVGSSEIPRASTKGGVSLPDTLSKDIKTQWKRKICKKAKLTWQGLHKLAQVIEPMVPKPFDTPLTVFNAISDAAEKYFDNEKELKDMMEQLSSCLEEVNRGLLRSEDYGNDFVKSSEQLAKLIVEEALEIHKIQSSSLTEKTLAQDDVTQKICDCLYRLNRGTQEHHRNMTQIIIATVNQGLEHSLASKLSFAPQALFKGDQKAGVPSRRACTPKTRENLLHHLETWAQDTSADSSPVFWLSGMAGTGKSTIAYTLCQSLNSCDRLGASFFCSRNEEQTRSRKFIIPTIIRRLLRVYKPLVNILRHVDLDSVNAVSDDHIDQLLVQPWSTSWQPINEAPFVIVIDALDEIEDNQGANFIEQLISSLSRTPLRGLKFLLTSRPHPDIKKSCDQLRARFRLEEIKPIEVKEDIRRFLCEELSHLEQELDPVVEESGGIFIYAATVVRHIRPPGLKLTAGEQRARLKQLRAVGFGKAITADEQLVDSLYETVTREALRNPGPEVKIPQRVLYAVVTANHPLTLQALASLVVDASEEADEEAINDNLEKVQKSLDSLYAVLYVSERDDCVYAYHKSFDDFILNRSQLAQLAATYFPNRTQECFDIMNKSLHFNTCDLKSSYLLDEEDEGLHERIATSIGPELRYACRHWAGHLTSVRHNDQHVKQLAALLLDFSRLKVLFWMEAMNLLKADCRHALHQAHSWSLQISDTEELIGYLSASRRLWASFAAGEPSLSTPHLYVSSLTAELAMSESSTLVAWRQHFPGLPFMECKGIARIAMLMSAKGHANSVTSVAFSPDGTRVVSSSQDKTVCIWDATTGAILGRMEGHTDSVTSVAFSPDGAHVVSGSSDRTIRIWDVTTGAALGRMEGHTSSVRSVAFSPDGTRIVSGSSDNTMYIWDATTGAALGKMQGHTKSVAFIAFSPNGTHVVSGSSDRTMCIWDVMTGAALGRTEGHTHSVTSVAFSPDGTRFVSGSDDKAVRIWDVMTGAVLRKMEGHTESVMSVAFSPDRTRIVSGSYMSHSHDSTVHIWDVTTGATVGRMEGHTGSVTSVAFSHDGTRVMSGSDDRTVRIWDATASPTLGRMEAHTDLVRAVAFSPDGIHIVSGSHDNTVRIWDAKTGAELGRMEGHTGSVTSVAFSPDGAHIVSSSDDTTLRIWDVTTGATLGRMEGHTHSVMSVAFSPNGTCVVSGSHDRSVRIWDATTGAAQGRMEGHIYPVTSVAFSPDGTHIVSGSGDKSMHIWDTTTGAMLGRIEGHIYLVTSVAFSPDGACIVSGSSDKTVCIWDATTGAMVGKMEGHTGSVRSVAFSLDGTRIVSGSDDETVRIWDATTGAALGRMEGHTHSVTSVAFSPDSARVVSGSYDQTVRIWEVMTGATLGRMEGHTNKVRSVAFFPDGTCSRDSNAQLSCTLEESGWLVLHDSIRLFWYPPRLRLTLLISPCILLISHHGYARLDPFSVPLGPDWAKCYCPRPTNLLKSIVIGILGYVVIAHFMWYYVRPLFFFF
ncbi:WD40 repeat-like protein [Mycena leptocephala]|nr:WD40 repeat-like protein [Mycena leptocephala]